MPIQRNSEKVVPTLLKRLAEAKRHASVTVTVTDDLGNNPSELDELFDNIEKEIQDMQDVFPRVKNWENLVLKEFDDLEQDITDEVFEVVGDAEQKEKMKKKLESMNDKITEIKRLSSPVQPEPIGSITTSSQSQNSTNSMYEYEPHKTSDDWLRFSMEKNILESKETMANLQVSYDILQLQLKLCLLCFSIFPENSVIKKRPLIYWWIGEGLVTHTKDKTAEEIGEGLFEELMKKDMIKPESKNRSPVVDSCRVHPWIRRMLILVAKNVGFFDFDDIGNPTPNFSTCRRACLATNARLITNGSNLKPEEMLTVFNIDEHYLNFTRDCFSKLKKVVVLQLGRWQNSVTHHIEIENDEFLNDLGAQKHLKYLSLQGISRITELPASIAKLTNLKILDLRACHNLEKLPSGITSMNKLTHLDVSECYLLEQIPKGLELLVQLQVLKGFVLGNSRSKDPCKLSELAKLKKLRKLSIYVGSDAVVAEAELGVLQHFETLCVLTVIWGGVVRPPPTQGNRNLKRAATMTMSSLSIPQNLKKLDLRCFPQAMASEWLTPSKLENLNRLYIRGGKLHSLGDESDTWNVKILRLKYLEDLKMEWAYLHKAFGNLEYLEMIGCKQLTSFECDEHGVWEKKKVVEAGTNTP